MKSRALVIAQPIFTLIDTDVGVFSSFGVRQAEIWLFAVTLVDTIGPKRMTRSAAGTGRVLEGRALLIIINPRPGDPNGLLAIVEAKRTK